MSSPLRVPLSPLGPGRVVLPEATGRYVSRVHRLSPGDAFLAFDPEARTEADAVIQSAGREVICDVGAVRPAGAVARRDVTLIQAMGKGDKPEQIVRDATALGATRIVFVYTTRSVPRATDRDETKGKRLRAVAVEAARQSGRGDVPVLDGPLPLSEALDDSRPGFRVCLSPSASQPLAGVLQGWTPASPLAVLIGPEGGLDDAEVLAASERGFVLASFGEFVLRTETAAVAVLGALCAIGAARQGP